MCEIKKTYKSFLNTNKKCKILKNIEKRNKMKNQNGCYFSQPLETRSQLFRSCMLGINSKLQHICVNICEQIGHKK